MKSRTLLWGCLLVAGLAFVLVVAGGVWWYLRGQSSLSSGPPPSPVQVFLLEPSSGDDVHAGDHVTARVNAFGPETIVSADLYVDGTSLGVVADGANQASWTWQAWPAGVHTLSARATDSSGAVGNSQPVIVNVVALAGSAQVSAENGETLAQLGARFGVPPDQMAGANPGTDPNTPLNDGDPVNVPTGNGGGNGPPPGGGKSPPVLIWDLKLKAGADKSYCYISGADGSWEKIPKEPFDFFGQLENLYKQLLKMKPPQNSVVQAQCWAWIGNALEFLGEGQGKFDGKQVMIIGDAFQLAGQPQEGGPQADYTGPAIPPPYALREATETADCAAHKGSPAFCSAVLNAALKTQLLLEWEWQPGINFPDPNAINKIDGFEVYENEPSSSQEQLISVVSGGAIHVASVPLPWGARCYAVDAFAATAQFGTVRSKQSNYCPGEEPATQVLTLTPIDWLSSDRQLWNDCSIEAQDYTNQANPPAIFVGGRDVNATGNYECTARIIYSGAVEFGSPVLPPGGVLLQAFLKATKVYGYFFVSQTAGPGYDCVHALGTAKEDWSALGLGHHSYGLGLDTPTYFNPLTSQVNLSSTGTDVTSVVSSWLNHPSEDKGFIFVGVPPSLPPDGGNGECYTGLGNFRLEIHYIAP